MQIYDGYIIEKKNGIKLNPSLAFYFSIVFVIGCWVVFGFTVEDNVTVPALLGAIGGIAGLAGLPIAYDRCYDSDSPFSPISRTTTRYNCGYVKTKYKDHPIYKEAIEAFMDEHNNNSEAFSANYWDETFKKLNSKLFKEYADKKLDVVRTDFVKRLDDYNMFVSQGISKKG